MTHSSFAASFVDDLLGLYASLGARTYGEGVSQIEHALQSAHHARVDGASPSLVAACLLHDVGHMVQKLGEDAADRGRDDHHEMIGAGVLGRGFGPDVVEPVRLHVQAKRYLAAFEPGYLELLSPASLKSLRLQGWLMTAEEAETFLAHPAAENAILLRRYDERGKVQSVELDGLDTYRDMLCALVDQHQASSGAA